MIKTALFPTTEGSNSCHGPGGSSHICQTVQEVLLGGGTRLLHIAAKSKPCEPTSVLAVLSQPQVEITRFTVKRNVNIPMCIFCVNFDCYSNENSSKDAQRPG